MAVLNRFRVDDKVCVVTGASSGLGVAFATALAEMGGHLVIVARRAERLEEIRGVLERAGAEVLTVPADVASPEACRTVKAAAVERFGRIDVLVNNAGLGGAAPASGEDPDHFRRIIEVNLHGSYWMAQAAVGAMGPGSSIVNVSSVLAVTTAGLPQAAYSASKAALLGLTRDLAAQWSGRKGVRVNAILPAFMPSEMLDLYDETYLRETVERRVLLGRVGTSEECATAVVFLASEASSYITGSALSVDGGMAIT